MNEDSRYLCTQCYGGTVPLERWKLGYSTCMPCGEQLAKEVRHTIVPMHKGNYIKVTDLNDLKDLNPKYIRSAR
jgi:ribosomal protein L37AE/L43A